MIYPLSWASQYSVVYKTGWWKIAQFQPDAWLCGSSSPCFIGIIPQVLAGQTCQDRSDSKKSTSKQLATNQSLLLFGTDYGSYRNSSWSVLVLWIMAQMMQMKVQLAAVRWSSTSPIDDLLPAIFTCHMTVFLLGIYDMTGLGNAARMPNRARLKRAPLGCHILLIRLDRLVPCFFWVIHGSNNGNGKSE